MPWSRPPSVWLRPGIAAVATITIAAGIGGAMTRVKAPSGASVNRNIQCWGTTGATVMCLKETGQLSVSGAVVSGGATIGTGAALTLSTTDNRYVEQAGDTMTGELIVSVAGEAITASGSVKMVASDGTQRGLWTTAGALTLSGALSTDSNITINQDNGAVDAVLTFGNSVLAETLTFITSISQFEFSDDLRVTGDLSSSGTLSVETAIKTDGAISAGGNLSGATLTLSGGKVNVLNSYVTVPLFGSGTVTATGTNLRGDWNVRLSGKIVGAGCNVSITANDNNTTCDIKINGTSIFTTVPIIEAAEDDTDSSATPGTIDATLATFVSGDKITFDVTAPSTTPATHMDVFLTIEKTLLS